MYQKIVANLDTAKLRTETVGNRTFHVVGGTILKSQVLNGSEGPLFYPQEEIEANYADWNGMPVVINHPFDPEGKPISARCPEVLLASQVGNVYRSAIHEEGPLNVEAWVDDALADRVEPRLLSWLKAGKPIGVSTGLFSTREKAPEGSVHNGVAYDEVTRNYKPDHLAILLDEVGACSIDDGCGLQVNKVNDEEEGVMNWLLNLLGIHGKAGAEEGVVQGSPPPQPTPTKAPALNTKKERDSMALTAAQRKAYVDYLTTNCDCWGG